MSRSSALAVLVAALAALAPEVARAGLCANYYTDYDGDGYGGSTYVYTCTPGAYHTTVTGDCDDGDGGVHPGARESCDGEDDDCDGTIDEGVKKTYYADADKDGYGGTKTATACSAPSGYTATSGDCNDLDASVNPGRTELCNSKDDDCDGVTDESDASDAGTWYADVDADGYGNAAKPKKACSQPSGYVASATDCDDTSAAVSPAATETCNTVDDDCDGKTDEPDAADAGTWYADTDEDGYGDAASTTVACAAPTGFVAADGDCDDTDPAVSPGNDERCNGTDDDCDGKTDEPDAVDAPTWYADADADTYGDPASPVQACNQPTGHVADATDCDDTDGSVSPVGVEVCNAVDDDCDASVDESATDAPTWYADADADAYGDAGSPAVACEAPTGHVSDATDCDDADTDVNPGASELCNTVDDDCDGTTDEGDAADATVWYADADGDGYGTDGDTTRACTQPTGHAAEGGDCDDADPTASPATVWYADADADGFGDPSSTRSACLQPVQYVADATDCDDADAEVNPDGTEVCGGGDENCDGRVDEYSAADITTWYYDDDRDGYGDPTATRLNCEKPPSFVADATDCDDHDASVNPGAAETCDGVDEDCSGVADDDPSLYVTAWADADGDGYGDAGSSAEFCGTAPSGHVANDDDCDDGAASVHPTATETCDGVDQDCDGTVDDGAKSTFYRDADGDGYGSTATTALACSAPSGYVADATDCNDGSASVHPAATEACNAADDDCDGTVDEGVKSTFYRDADGDGYGRAASTLSGCSAPSGYVADATDCDDTRTSVHPGATEVCNTRDDDCDGATDEGVTTTFYADVDADGFGGATTTQACALPTGYAAIDGDCDDASDAVWPGANELCDGADNDCDGAVDETAPVWYADADADGYGTSASTTSGCTAPTGYVGNASDCDDGDGTVHPGAPESCDGADEDCDGVVDDGVGDTYYADADEDGFGDVAAAVRSCSGAPTGTVSDATDCDDERAEVFPDATETCNAVDDDCDGEVDEDAADAVLWYTDSDADGYGADGSARLACDDPDGMSVLDGGDCDDGDGSVHPGAAEAPDGQDEDCDGIVDEGTVLFDDDGDGATEAGGDCDDTTGAIGVGVVEVCDSVDEDCDGIVDEDTECYDDDGDGWMEIEGDCDDDDAAIAPDAPDSFGDGIDQDCDGADGVATGPLDADGDGYDTTADCDDTDPEVHPGAPERANGQDDDCDGAVDEGLDGDGDGFTVEDGDCDDADPDVNPDAEETHDGRDEDCDETVDEGTDGYDDDGDGFTEEGGDCDDDDAGANPRAEEIGGNERDDDCDGETDESDDPIDTGAPDVDGDGYTADLGDCDDGDELVYPQAYEICDGLDNDCDGTIDDGCSEDGTKGCGCAIGASAPLGWLPLLMGLLVARRRSS